jgi:hypothetical protein
MRIDTNFALLAVLLIAASSCVHAQNSRRVQFWLCGAFCSADMSVLKSQLDLIAEKVPGTTHISVGSWTLGDDGVTISKAPGFEDFASNIKNKGFIPVGYIFENNREKMIRAMSSPKVFAANAIHAAQASGYSGFELDWEPSDSSGDGTQYAQFLKAVGSELQSSGITLSADILTSGPFFSFEDIAQATRGTTTWFSDMNTYEREYFDGSVKQALTAFGHGPISIGVDVSIVTDPQMIQQRFNALQQQNVCQFSVWNTDGQSQLLEPWIAGINQLISRCAA